MVTNEEVSMFIEKRKLFGRGLGWMDAHLLASVLISNAGFLTLDKKILAITDELKIQSKI